MNTQTFGSTMASLRPAHVLPLPLPPTVSRAIRSCASWRSSGLSHLVVRGSSGNVKHAMMARTKVTAPWMMKSHCHPEIPETPSRPSKTPAAISPANAVARIFPEYSTLKFASCC